MADNKSIHKYKAGDIFHERYVLEKLIGVGGFADVWKATDTKTNTVVAIKIYTNLDEDGITGLAEEYTKMKDLNHPNILKAEHFDNWGNIPYLVMKYCEGGSLDKKVGKMTEEALTDAIKQITNGLIYLHEQKIVHQDIKPANILCYDNFGKTIYLLSDFGISSKTKTRLSKSVDKKNLGVSMTESYAPPEKFSPKKADRAPDRKGDIFSLGISIYELASGSLPFDDLSTGRELQYGNAEVDFSEIGDAKLRRIAELCMQPDKSDRPSAEELQKMMSSSDVPDGPRLDPKKATTRGKREKKNNNMWLIMVIAAIIGGGAVFFIADGGVTSCNRTEESEIKKGFAQEVDTFTINGIHLEMVKIPGGSFKLGCSDSTDVWADQCEKPAKLRQVADFSLGKYEVTQKLWTAIMGKNPSTMINDNYPVNNVSWEDCQLFIEKLNRITGRNFRLPTEAEWEYAAKTQMDENGSLSTTTTKFSGSDMPESVAWFADNSEESIHPVGEKKPNGYGLYDMSGNVIEWCQDIYTNYSTGDPELDKNQRVLRGGYFSGDKASVRTTSRGSCNYSTAMAPFGLRLCL